MNVRDEWTQTTLGQLGKWTSGGTPSRSEPSYFGGTIPWVKTGELNDGVVARTEETLTELGIANSAAHIIPAGSLLIAMYGATIGRLGILGMPATTNQACAALVADEQSREWIPFVFHFLRSKRDELRAAGKGGAQPNISQALLKEFPIALPSAAERDRIVSFIEDVLARSARARESLDGVPPLLEKLRQSILAAAFRGDLTADWRAKNPDVEPADALLARIRVERRKKWEEAELAKMKAKGKAPTDDRWKAKYTEPEPVGVGGLPALPCGWTWASADEIRAPESVVVYGIIQPGDDIADGVPYVRPADMAEDGTVDVRELKKTTREIAAQYARAALEPGDVVLSIVGTIGKVLVAGDELRGANITQSSARIRPAAGILSRYLQLALLSPPLRRQYDKHRFGNAVQRLNVEHVRSLAIPIAPAAEQAQLVSRTGDALSHLREAELQSMRATLATLDAAILAKAFRGELSVANDDRPADETHPGPHTAPDVDEAGRR